MKVLMFGWEYPPSISGGLGTACLGITSSLAKKDVEVTFVLPKLMGDYSEAPVNVVGPKKAVRTMQRVEEVQDETELVKRYKVDSALHPYMDKKTYAEYLVQLEKRRKNDNSFDKSFRTFEVNENYGPDLMNEVSRYSTVGRYFVEENDFDIIHAHDWMTFQAGVEAKKASGKPLVLHVHSTEFDRTGNRINNEIYCIEKYGMDMADVIVAVSQRTKGIVVEKYGQDPKKVTVVYNGVEQEKRAMEAMDKPAFKNDKIVLFLGRITVQKGPEYFLEAANLVLKKMKDVRFVMAGSGDMSRQMIEQMASLRLMDKFHFTGFLNPAERDKLFAMSDLFVMPSVSEPFGITPLEAMKYDVPVIISKQSGIGEILEHVTKVDFWDVRGLSESIISVLSDPKKGAELRKQNNIALEKITWDGAAEKILELYKGALEA